jgi:hypothetical protein
MYSTTVNRARADHAGAVHGGVAGPAEAGGLGRPRGRCTTPNSSKLSTRHALSGMSTRRRVGRRQGAPGRSWNLAASTSTTRAGRSPLMSGWRRRLRPGERTMSTGVSSGRISATTFRISTRLVPTTPRSSSLDLGEMPADEPETCGRPWLRRRKRSPRSGRAGTKLAGPISQAAIPGRCSPTCDPLGAGVPAAFGAGRQPATSRGAGLAADRS